MTVIEKKLTLKEQAFILEYCIDLNATQAAIKAWYSEKTAKNIASENLTKPHIMKEVQKELTKKFAKVEKDWDRVIRMLVELTERCMQKVPVLDKEGNETWERKFDSSWANSALDKLGKYYKLFTERVEVKAVIETISEDQMTLIANRILEKWKQSTN